jgi:predicted Zn-dependent protease
MWMVIDASPTDLKIISLVWTDVEALTDDGLDGVLVSVKVGHQHFNDAQRKFLGACQQKSDKSFEVVLRPLTSGALYLTCLHEIGHVLGLKHTQRGVMIAASRHRQIPLTPERRRRWLRDFGRQLLDLRLSQLNNM